VPRLNVCGFRRPRRRRLRWSLKRPGNWAGWLVFPAAIAVVIAINPPTWISASVSDPGWIAEVRYSGTSIAGPVTHVRDGDTVEVLGTPIRLAKLDCAERGTAAGERATARMRELARAGAFSCSLPLSTIQTFSATGFSVSRGG
jgi:endonuclease YncB( thermonuclease family)